MPTNPKLNGPDNHTLLSNIINLSTQALQSVLFAISSLTSLFSTQRVQPHFPSDLSDVPTSELHSAVSNPQLVQQKHEHLAARISTDANTRNMIIVQCAVQAPHLLPELMAYISCKMSARTSSPRGKANTPAIHTALEVEQRNPQSTPAATASQSDDAVRETEARRVREIVDDQRRLEYASQRYREAGEAFHFWEAEIFQINGRMKTRGRLAEAARKARGEK
ncbi:hypothetical protein FMUND_7595 [Fusarium mundagurra]|uniref:Uncharacterized protein n=1 Tax=Fusarium mundagurra TaxID=1567541 RepID=A0A8H5YK68_9HYPO|nr:hypothetical protein FMUND_7595 [Fusarium mundagurra]